MTGTGAAAPIGRYGGRGGFPLSLPGPAVAHREVATDPVLVTVSGPMGTADLEWGRDLVLGEALAPVARSCAGVGVGELVVVVAGRGALDLGATVGELSLRSGVVVNVFAAPGRTPASPPAPAPAPIDPAVAEVVNLERPGPASAVAGSAWAFAGLHGGAGATTLARAIGGADGPGGGGVPVVAVARTHGAGLAAAQARSRLAEPPVLGLALVADAPGRLPPPARDLVRLVCGAYEHVWRIGWEEALRFGPYDPDRLPHDVRRLRDDLVTLTSTPEQRSIR